MKYFALIDHYKIDGTRGNKRFSIKQIDYTPMTELDKSVICVDKYKGNIESSIKLLLEDWESDKYAPKQHLASPRQFVCVTSHSVQPWYQVKAEVEARGYEFTS